MFQNKNYSFRFIAVKGITILVSPGAGRYNGNRTQGLSPPCGTAGHCLIVFPRQRRRSLSMPIHVVNEAKRCLQCKQSPLPHRLSHPDAHPGHDPPVPGEPAGRKRGRCFSATTPCRWSVRWSATTKSSARGIASRASRARRYTSPASKITFRTPTWIGWSSRRSLPRGSGWPSSARGRRASPSRCCWPSGATASPFLKAGSRSAACCATASPNSGCPRRSWTGTRPSWKSWASRSGPTQPSARP